MGLTGQQWTIVLRQESFSVRFGVIGGLAGRRGHIRFDADTGGVSSGSPRSEPGIMRYELKDHEWGVIRPMLPNRPRGIPVSMTGVFSTASSGSCDRGRHGATCRRAAAHIRLAIIASFGGRHVHCARTPARSLYRSNRQEDIGRSRGGLTGKIHAVVDAVGLPVRLGLTLGEHTAIASARFS